MQEERNSGHGGGFQNRDSYYSRMHSNMSIQRLTSRRSTSPLVRSKISLIDAMDLQIPTDRYSSQDLYTTILNSDTRRSSTNNYKRSSTTSRNEYLSGISRQSDQIIQTKFECENERRQSQWGSRCSIQKQMIHECNCTLSECNAGHCSCYLFPNQLCIIGLCCARCIKNKNQFLANNRIQLPQSITNNNGTGGAHISNGCLCKNIKCMKLYCRCFRQGKKCQPNVCKCDGCENVVDGLLEKKKKRIEFQLKKQNFMQENGHALVRQNNFLKIINQGNQHPIDPITYSFINCACKRSHCLKKYCSCFLHSKPCSQACACEQCQNIYDENDNQQERRRKERYARIGDDEDDEQIEEGNEGEIGRFLTKYERNYESDEMNEDMEFQPVNFGDIVEG